MSCVFCNIIDKKIPAQIIYEDAKILVFKDLTPAAPVHVLVIPKIHISDATDITDKNSEIIGYIFEKIAEISTDLGLEDGFRIVANCGDNGGQTVRHLHFHVLGGKQLGWPPC